LLCQAHPIQKLVLLNAYLDCLKEYELFINQLKIV
jgi:hypothetical protein